MHYDEAIAQAEVQLKATQAQDINLGVLRAQYEHAIGFLTGEPASTFSIPAVEVLEVNPPAIPLGIPSQLLERPERSRGGCFVRIRTSSGKSDLLFLDAGDVAQTERFQDRGRGLLGGQHLMARAAILRDRLLSEVAWLSS